MNISLLGVLRLKELVLVDIVRDDSAWYNITFITAKLIEVSIFFEDAIKIGWFVDYFSCCIKIINFITMKQVFFVLIKQEYLVIVDAMIKLIGYHFLSLELNSIMLYHDRVRIIACRHLFI